MAKQVLKAGTNLAPIPASIISCGTVDGKKNLISLAWVGIVNSDPPMLSISVRPQRHSHQMIKDSGEFVVNVPTRELLAAVDFCGNTSGRDVDKFAGAGLTALPASKVAAPVIAECPINLECRVRQVIPLGSHDLFLAEIVAVQANDEVLENGRISAAKVHTVAYGSGEYLNVEGSLGRNGSHFRKK